MAFKVKAKEYYKNLRDLVISFKETEWYKKNTEAILFELNHLELHGLDDYLFKLYKNKFVSDKNPGNSNVSFLIGLTTQEPVGRVKTKGGTTPDIDSDFEDEKRILVKEYLKTKYGADKVSNIGTFQVSKCKGLFKDLARIFELPFEESNNISKLLPDDADATIKNILEEKNEKTGQYVYPELRKLAAENEKIARIFEYANHIEGSIRAVGVHASGVALTSLPVTDIVPLFESKGEAVTQYDGITLEKMGIIKFDLLGLKNLTTISRTLKLIEEKHGKKIDLYSIDLNDQKVYDLIASGDLLGVFQMEGSTGLMEFARKAKPKTIVEVSAIIALYRPGPMGMGALEMYIKRSNNRDKKWEFEIPEFSHIFKDTYGLLVYQEQLMRLSREMCGFTDIEADELRKAVGKKDRELLLKQKERFVNGAVTHTNQNKDRINDLFDSMEEFARYCFNLSHSICYAFIAYQTAWLKTYYKKEYLASLISTEGDPDQKALYIENARTNRIKVVPPDINQSVLDFTVGNDDSILFGFNSIKGVGEKAALKILDLQPFNSIGDFLIKAHHAKGINKKTLEALIYCGAFDCFGYQKSALLSGFTSFIFDYVNELSDPNTYDKKVADRYISLEESYFDASLPELSFLDVLEKEKELLGIYLSSSPFGFIKRNTKYGNLNSFSTIPSNIDKSISILCRIEAKKVFTNKAGKTMCFIDAIDENNKFESFVIFSEAYNKLEKKIKDKIYAVLKVSVKRKSKESSSLSLIVNDFIDLTEELNESIKKIEFKNAIRQVSLVFDSIPSVVRIRSIQSIISEYQKPDDNACKVDLVVNLGKAKVNIGSYKIAKIDVNFLRAFSKIKDVYVTRDNK